MYLLTGFGQALLTVAIRSLEVRVAFAVLRALLCLVEDGSKTKNDSREGMTPIGLSRVSTRVTAFAFLYPNTKISAGGRSASPRNAGSQHIC